MDRQTKKELEQTVFSYPSLVALLEAKSAERKKVLKNLYEIAADFSPRVINSFSRLVDLGIKQLYDGINISFEHKLEIKKLVANNNVVLVPNHQSHADYVALNYIFYRLYKFPLYVAGGINLNVFPIGKLFRKSGCFFIRRSFASDTYKQTLEGYLYYLLKKGKPIEFFFEGGRSRTGKLLSPKYGLYQMLLKAHEQIPSLERKPLLFLPVSIVHEYVPEQKTLSSEMDGSKKKKESFAQMWKLFKLFTKEFGSVHIRFGRPVPVRSSVEVKKITHQLAFDCYNTVSKNMTITPSSLLALIMLDEPIGAIKWDDILSKAQHIISYCQHNMIPMTESLKPERLIETLEHSIDLFIANKKINVIGRTRFGHVFYSIKEECRKEILYFKNSILHHFYLPWIINLGWVNIFNGTIVTYQDLKEFIKVQSNQLRHEFSLPTLVSSVRMTLNLLSRAMNRKVLSLRECIYLTPKELYDIAVCLGTFSRGCSYIFEGYYLAAQTVRSLSQRQKLEFDMEDFRKCHRDTFDFELNHGRLIKYLESNSIPLMRNSLKYLTDEGFIEFRQGTYHILQQEKLDQLVGKYAKDLADQLTFNLRV